MKVVLLAGGLGTRISEESHLKPKPMIDIGGKPILWHIMKIYSAHGMTDFVICCGYKGYVIKEYFANYFLHNSDVTFDLKSNKLTVHQNDSENWRVTLVDTGEATQTGGRLKRIQKHLEGETDFCFTYGDGVANINIREEIDYHREHKKMATVAAVQPAGRFGRMEVQGESVRGFTEKPQGDGAYINGGFFVLKTDVLKFLKDDSTIWEREPLEQLVQQDQLRAFRHTGFWQPMDTLRDKLLLEDLWKSEKPPWKIW